MPLTDPRAIEIISKARRPNVARPRTSHRDFDRIFKDFFRKQRRRDGFAGQLVMDLGPGQFDFPRMIREYGGECECIDYDAAVLELADYLGFRCFNMDMKQMDATELRARYDGLFCKFSISGFWYADPEAARNFVHELDSMLKPTGWGWIAPWNGRPKHGFDDDRAAVLLDVQKDAFRACGWTGIDLTKKQAAHYGMGGVVDNNPLFVKHLAVPESFTQ